jgi:hypothetical protein
MERDRRESCDLEQGPTYLFDSVTYAHSFESLPAENTLLERRTVARREGAA